MEIFMGIPSQTFSCSIQLKRESELVLTFPEEPFPLIITTFLSFCYSSHTDGFFSSSAREKRMSSSQWVPLSRIIWRHRTDLRASQNLFPHPIPNASQVKAFKGWKRTFPCHSISAQKWSWNSLSAALLIHPFSVQIEQFIKCLRLPTVPMPGVQLLDLMGARGWASPGSWLCGEPNFTPSPTGESGFIPPNAAALTRSHCVSHSPTRSSVD